MMKATKLFNDGRQHPVDSGKSYEFFNDLRSFDGKKWKRSGAAGDKRSGIRMAYDTKRNKLFSYGGYSKSNSLPDMLKEKSWEIYKSWGLLVAAYGIIGVTIDVDKKDYNESIKKLHHFINSNGKEYQIDIEHLGVFASSHIPDDAVSLFIKEPALNGFRAVAFYYHEPSL